MNKEQLEDQWRDYAALLPYDALAALLAPLENYCGEPVQILLPSTQLGTAGPILSTVFACTQNYLSELATAEKQTRFDMIDRRVVARIALTFLSFQLAQPEGEPVNLPAATLEINHGFQGSSMATIIGEGVAAWVERAKLMFPPTLLLAAQPGGPFEGLAPKGGR